MGSQQPNIVWVTLDSVRADHTSLHGYERDTTPEMAELANRSDGIAFEQCIAHSTRTPVSVPSMLTGTYPSHHRVGIGVGPCGEVPESMPTVPELLADCGYYTAAVSRNVYAGRATGLDRRFDEFVSPTVAGDLLKYPHVLTLLKYGLGARHHSGGLTTDKQRHPKSFLVTDVAKRLLANSPDDRPTFLYCHYNDPHRPYWPSRSYVGRYTDDISADPAEAVAFAADMHENAYEYMAAGIPFSDRQWEMLYAMYDAGIAYTDECVGSLIRFVEQELDDTVLVVTADHGELFGERGLLGHHIVLDDALVHVPCVVAGLPEVADARESVVQHVDLAQTLLEVAGADAGHCQGIDLRTDRREYAVSQDLRGTVDDDETRDYDRILQYDEDFDVSGFHRSLLTAVRSTAFKLLHTDEWTRLYDLPDETTDDSSAHPDVYEEFTAFLDSWFETAGQPFAEAPKQTTHEAGVQRQLRELGYLE